MDQKAILRIQIPEVLSRKWGDNDGHSIANLERYIELHPEMYVKPSFGPTSVRMVVSTQRNQGAPSLPRIWLSVATNFGSPRAHAGACREGVLKADLLLVGSDSPRLLPRVE